LSHYSSQLRAPKADWQLSAKLPADTFEAIISVADKQLIRKRPTTRS